MHVISRPAIRQAIERHPDATGWLEKWWQNANKERWENLLDVRPSIRRLIRWIIVILQRMREQLPPDRASELREPVDLGERCLSRTS